MEGTAHEEEGAEVSNDLFMAPANVVRSLLIHWVTTACNCRGPYPREQECPVHSRGGQEKQAIAEAVAERLSKEVDI